MADVKLKLDDNVDGVFFVDSTCIDCDACRKFAPGVFGETGEHSFVKRQPQNREETLAAQQALIACPVGSIGTTVKMNTSQARDSLPLPLAEGIYLNGFNHADSFGADSYFIRSDTGNWLVDSPRFTPHLRKQFEAWGGVRTIFLTHRDDVADAHLYARHFGAERIIHRFDADAQKDAEIVLDGTELYVRDKAKILFTPGHTRGHLVLLWDERFLFTGDHFAWLAQKNRFGSFRRACWYSWEAQIASVDAMKVFEHVEWILPGHGKRRQIERGRFPEIVADAVDWMRSVA